ncbi:Gfo/Idh/MocA family oxidoreductase [Actinospica sp. MGRD01-02]|uniref:Gfo/Idh/MocA family oxidoreductase n=1 Tax=Actinospica acidithermotolerans TaxID=2828514 RepID=A0A941EHQ6_9ACTN|nr:Gfo/Idh/MocA family oxidoreductase [Actinospica acidithermotolerans]MBR7831008.1 Gfo/Idh/MocA family oxidoreductase [Actinospica acidithermotolerans]
MSEIRLGLIGAGAVGALHAEAARNVPGVTVTAVCDLVPAAAKALAAPDGARVFTEHGALLDSGEVDAVIINTPHALHTEIVRESAAAGLHVLVEKPMATTSRDCVLMTRACARAGVVLAVGHIQHTLPPMAAVKEVLEQGGIGALRAVDDWRSTDYRPGTRPSWFFDPAVSGGGVFMNIGAHCVDRLLWLADRPVATVTATAAYGHDARVETEVQARVQFADGLAAHIRVTSAPLPARNEMVLVGERGSIRISTDAGALLYPHDGDGWGRATVLAPAAAEDVADAFATQLAAFAATVRGEREPLVSPRHGQRVIEVIEAVYASSRTGLPQTLDDADSWSGDA